MVCGTKYRINRRHQCKCYITLPLDHLSKNVSEIIKSQLGFDSCKVKVIKGINNVPEKAHKVVAIGVHQTISEDDIKAELAKNKVKINKVQRLKFIVIPPVEIMHSDWIIAMIYFLMSPSKLISHVT